MNQGHTAHALQTVWLVGALLAACDPSAVNESSSDNALPASRDDGSGPDTVRHDAGDNVPAPAPATPEPVVDASSGSGDAGPQNASDAAVPVPVDCSNAALPGAGMLGRLTAGAGINSDGAGVLSWQDQAKPERKAQRATGGPRLIADAVAGKPAVRFDGVDDVLHWPDWQLNGKTELTVALVNASDFKAPGREWCCSDDETGCSGTYHVPLFWNGTADWSGVMIAPVQGEVALRIGNGVKHYSDGFYETEAFKVCENGLSKCPGGIAIGSNDNCCGYGSCQVDWQRDPGVAWRRPAAIGRDFSLSVVVKSPSQYELFVAGERVYARNMPGGVSEIKNAESYARIGSAGPFSTRRWQGDIAEIVVYDRALEAADRQALEHYLSCEYFPSE